MRKLGLLFIGLLAFQFFYGQTEDDPVAWAHDVISKGDHTYDLSFTGEILEGWHVYSQYTAEGGSMPSIFTYVGAGESYELIGKTTEGKTEKAFSDIFEVEETFFKGKAEFFQTIKLKDTTVRQIRVELFYQVCKEVCIPKDIVFEIALDGGPVISEEVALDEESAAIVSGLNIDLKNKDVLYDSEAAELNEGGNTWMIFLLGFLGGFIA